MDVLDVVFPQEVDRLRETRRGKDWPVVYILSKKNEAYIGEASSAYIRLKQHSAGEKRRLDEKCVLIISDDFNKSAVLDIEQRLIRLFVADRKYRLLNKNGGQSAAHNYYQREMYVRKMPQIWDALRG